MTWVDSLFHYCERGTNTGLLAEPVNVLTNVAFLVAAGLAYLHQRKQPSTQRDIDCTIFIILIALMGIGSTLLHMAARDWALILDAAPVAVFALMYLNFALNRYLDLTPGVSFLLTGAVVLTIPAFSALPGGITTLNGSIIFVPVLLAFAAISLILRGRGHPASSWLLAASTLFTLSLVIRTLDTPLCDLTAIAGHTMGTHGLWHVLNAVLLYLLVRAAIDYARHGEQTYEVLTPVGPKDST